MSDMFHILAMVIVVTVLPALVLFLKLLIIATSLTTELIKLWSISQSQGCLYLGWKQLLSVPALLFWCREGDMLSLVLVRLNYMLSLTLARLNFRSIV